MKRICLLANSGLFFRLLVSRWSEVYSFGVFEDLKFERGYGQTGSEAYLPAFLQFLSNFNETLSISLFFRGRLNHALRFDLIPLQSPHFTTAQRGLCTDFQTFLFIKVES